jgi:hypothetical protein
MPPVLFTRLELIPSTRSSCSPTRSNDTRIDTPNQPRGRLLHTMSSELLRPDTTNGRHTTRDWTEDLPQTDHVRFFRHVDWARTALGPLQQWGTALRMYTHMVMSDSRAATLYW